MQLFKTTNFDFIGNRNKAFIFSGILFLVTIISLIVHKGPNLSIDFVGGTVVQVQFEKPIYEELGTIRAAITSLNFGQPEVKTIGRKTDNEVQIIVRQQAEGTQVGDAMKEALAAAFRDNPFELRREEKVGPKIGRELQGKSFLVAALALVIILIYIAIRFHLPYGVAAIVALFHDVVVTIGVFSVFNAEFSLPIIAAILTIIGYSLNDTIVVFDRIRENTGGISSKKSFDEKVNTSINQCLSRTIITSLTTLVVVVIIFAFFFNSGDVIKLFSGALITGVIIGTYSSIFVASPVLVLWNKKWPIK